MSCARRQTTRNFGFGWRVFLCASVERRKRRPSSRGWRERAWGRCFAPWYSLVRGETALNNGDFVVAEHEFVGALQRARTSPAAASGLIAARMALRDHIGAAEAAKTLLDRRAVGWEPEWQFWLGPARDLDEAFDSLRAEAQGQLD